MRRALGGSPSATLLWDGRANDIAGTSIGASSLVQEYLPIVQQGGQTLAVMALWRGATPLLASLGQVQRDVIIVVLGAALVLAMVLFLVFRAAQTRISRHNFKLFNEAHGHDAADEVLLRVAGIIADEGAAVGRRTPDPSAQPSGVLASHASRRLRTSARKDPTRAPSSTRWSKLQVMFMIERMAITS